MGIPALFRIDDVIHHTADAAEDIDGRVVILGCQVPCEVDMAIENGAQGIRYRFVGVIAFHQHGIQPGNCAPIGGSSGSFT